MKHFILLFAMLLSIPMLSQYNKLAVSGEFGIHAVGDESAVVTDAFNHYGVTARYSLNPIVSVGVSGGFDNLSLRNLEGNTSETNYKRVSAEAFIDVFDILQLQNNAFTLLLHGGPGYSWFKNESYFSPNYVDDVFSLTGGVTGLVKLSRNFAISLDARITSNIGHDKTLDGFKDITNAEINSTISNFAMGIVFMPGKRGQKRQHADWYVAPEPEYVNLVHHTTNTFVSNNEIIKQANCDCEVLKYVFFEHDKTKILQSELSAITRVVTYMKNNPNAKLSIRGYASATQSSDDYNLNLSHDRAMVVFDKISEAGVDENRMSIRAYGKDKNWGVETLHDMARRVELIITK